MAPLPSAPGSSVLRHRLISGVHIIIYSQPHPSHPFQSIYRKAPKMIAGINRCAFSGKALLSHRSFSIWRAAPKLSGCSTRSTFLNLQGSGNKTPTNRSTTASRLRDTAHAPNVAHRIRYLSTNGGKQSGGKPAASFLQRFLAPKEMPPRGTLRWYGEMVLLCTVFGITGSSTMVLVRPAVSDILGLKGSFKDGPWSYRICSVVIMTPLYATLLVGVGTVFGRHAYFKHFAVKMFSRFGIPPELMDPTFHKTAKNFRKF